MNNTELVSLTLILALAAPVAGAGTYHELAERSAQRQYSAPVTMSAGVSIQRFAAPPPMLNGYHSPAPYYPLQGNSAMPMLPNGSNGMPSPRQVRWAYGQVNSASDPFNAWGLSAPGMYVPWSTPTSSWTNAQGWDWWRNRAGDDGPAPPLW